MAQRIRWEIGIRTNPTISRWKRKCNFLLFMRKNVPKWERIILWKFGLHSPFATSLDHSRFEVTDHESINELNRAIEKKFTGEVSFPIEEGENNGMGMFAFRVLRTQVRLCYRNQFRRDALKLVKGTFQRQTYKKLNVAGLDVLDIGANIGDSAIYFALKGANKVIALELYPSTFEIATLNINLNNLDHKVMVLNEGAGLTGSILINPDTPTGKTATARGNSEGVEISIYSLKELVERFSLEGAALKVNCEGCEYDLLLESSDEVISHFDSIVLEYHHGARSIRRKLEMLGYRVQSWDNQFSYNPNFSNPYCESGYLFATRSQTLI